MLCHLHCFTTGSQMSLTHTGSRGIWHQHLQSIPPQSLRAIATTPISRFACTLSTKEQPSSQAHAEDFALWTLISLWYETQISNTKQGPPNRLRLSELSVKDRSIRNLSSFVKWERQAFFTMLASSCICLLTKKK